METVLLVAYLMVVLALIAVILLQRSEGGGLGMGGSGGGGLVSARGSANLLTRTTGILAALFMASAIGLSILSGLDGGAASGILESAAEAGATNPEGGELTVLDALNQLQGDVVVEEPTTAPVADDAPDLAVPTTETPAAN